jgi:hypothetical protein
MEVGMRKRRQSSRDSGSMAKPGQGAFLAGRDRLMNYSSSQAGDEEQVVPASIV